jgi:hypothetical protein
VRAVQWKERYRVSQTGVQQVMELREWANAYRDVQKVRPVKSTPFHERKFDTSFNLKLFYYGKYHSLHLVTKILPPLWSTDDSSCYRSRSPGLESRRYQIFRVVSLGRGPLGLD